MYEPSITDKQVFEAVRDFLLLVLPTGTEVVRALNNKVAMPKGNFVTMQAVTQARLATNITENTLSENGDTQSIKQKIEYSIQLDVYGINAANNAVTVSTLFRDAFAYDSFPENIKPLYCDDPKQIEFSNAEMQYENRFMIMLYLQYDPVVTVDTQLAIELNPPFIYPVIEGLL